MAGMVGGRMQTAARASGVMRAALRAAIRYTADRKVFGAPIGRNQGVQFPLARAYAHMLAAEAIVYRAAGHYDAGQNPGVEANTAKMLAADASWEAAEACLQTHGGFGFAEEYDVERKFREARLYQVAPISTNLILCYIAEQVLGLPKSYGSAQ
jgi:alkylation response protein AidB-like acyl-CoA dehydrogenase